MRFFTSLLILSCFVLMNNARAYECTPTSDFIINVPILYTNPDISVMYERLGDVVTAAKKPIISCSSTQGISTMSIEFRAAGNNYPNQSGPDGNQIYLANTDINSGIIYNIGVDSDCGEGKWVKPGSNLLVICPSTGFASVTPKMQFFQVYGKTIPTNVRGYELGYFWIKINGQVQYSVKASYMPFNVVSVPCKVTTKSVQIPIGNFSKAQFAGALSTVGGTDFKISLQCTRSTGITLEIDPNGTSPNRSLGLIPISNSAGSASGVAIQLINNLTGKPQYIGKAISMNNANGGVFDMSFKARYIQGADTITPGIANGSATFTVRYQ